MADSKIEMSKITEPSNQPATFGPVAPYYDELMSGVPYQFWVDYIKNVWRRHSRVPQSILDVACGTGTVSRLLTRLGYRVAGVDLSQGMIDIAKEKASAEALDIDFRCQDAAEIDLGGQTFDAAISLFDSLNYILDPERLQAAFANSSK